MAYILKVVGDKNIWNFIVPGTPEYAAQWWLDSLDIDETSLGFKLADGAPLYGLTVEGDEHTWEFEVNLSEDQVADMREDGLIVDEIVEQIPVSFARGVFEEV